MRNFDCLELVLKEISYLVYWPSRSILKPENHAAFLAFTNKLAICWAQGDTELIWHEILDFSQKMGSEKFSLRWNDFESSISSSVGDLRDSEQFLDLTLVCGDDQIRAHKVYSNAWLFLYRPFLQGTILFNHRKILQPRLSKIFRSLYLHVVLYSDQSWARIHTKILCCIWKMSSALIWGMLFGYSRRLFISL